MANCTCESCANYIPKNRILISQEEMQAWEILYQSVTYNKDKFEHSKKLLDLLCDYLEGSKLEREG